MKNIKKDIKKIGRISGAHAGYILSKIIEMHPDADRELVKAEIKRYTEKKFASVKSSIRASVRYQ